MDINVTITHVLPASIEALLTRALRDYDLLKNPPLTATAPNGAPAETPAPAKRRAKADVASPTQTSQPPSPATTPGTTAAAPPAAPPPAPSPVPSAAGVVPTIDDLGRMTQATMKRIGVPAMRDLFKRQGIGRLLDLKPEQYSSYLKALQEAEAMLATGAQ